MKNEELTPIQIERPIYKIEELNKEHLYEKPYSTRKYAHGHLYSFHMILRNNRIFICRGHLLETFPGYLSLRFIGIIK